MNSTLMTSFASPLDRDASLVSSPVSSKARQKGSLDAGVHLPKDTLEEEGTDALSVNEARVPGDSAVKQSTGIILMKYKL